MQGMYLLLRQGEKVALVGANGLGKTTLLKTIVGKLPPVKGTARLGSRVMVGYFSQEHEGLFGDALLLEEVMGGFGLSETRARTLLGGMLFQGDDVLKKLSDLSGGERARLALLKLLLGGANFLVLDEPTNHLDIKAREVVEDALYEWPGSILAVSHDRYFLDKLSGRVWEVDGGRIWDYGGNYSYYRARKEEHLREEEKRLPVSAKTVAPSARNREKTGKRSPQDIEKRLSAVELSLREQDVLLKVLEKRLADPAEHGELAKSRALAEEYEHLKNIVEGLIIEWETLLEEQEKM